MDCFSALKSPSQFPLVLLIMVGFLNLGFRVELIEIQFMSHRIYFVYVFRDRPVNFVYRRNCLLLWEPYETTVATFGRGGIHLSVKWVPGAPPPLGPSGGDSSIYYRGLECVDVHLLFDIRLYDVVYNEVTRRGRLESSALCRVICRGAPDVSKNRVFKVRQFNP